MNAEQQRPDSLPQPAIHGIMIRSEAGLVTSADHISLIDSQNRGLIRLIEAGSEVTIIARQREGDKLVEMVPISDTCQVPSGEFLLTPTGDNCTDCGAKSTRTKTTSDASAHTVACEYCDHGVVEATRHELTTPAPLVSADSVLEDPNYDYLDYNASDIIAATAKNGCSPLSFLFPPPTDTDTLPAEATAALRGYDWDDPISLWEFIETSRQEMNKEYCIKVGEPIVFDDDIAEEPEQGNQPDNGIGIRLQEGLYIHGHNYYQDERVDVMTIHSDDDMHSLSLYIERDEYEEPAYLIIPADALRTGWRVLAIEDSQSVRPVNLLPQLSGDNQGAYQFEGPVDTDSIFGEIVLERSQNADGEVAQWAGALTNHRLPMNTNQLHISIDLANWNLDCFQIQREYES